MRDWKTKLTSRKFWLSVATFVTMLIVYFTGDTEKAEKISALIMAGAAVIGYTISEGLTDSASVRLEVKQAEQQPENSFFISVPDADKAK